MDLLSQDMSKTNKQKRYALYKEAARLLAYVGRIPIPECVEAHIKKRFPGDEFTGFKCFFMS